MLDLNIPSHNCMGTQMVISSFIACITEGFTGAPQSTYEEHAVQDVSVTRHLISTQPTSHMYSGSLYVPLISLVIAFMVHLEAHASLNINKLYPSKTFSVKIRLCLQVIILLMDVYIASMSIRKWQKLWIAMAAVPWRNMQILFYGLKHMPHPHIFLQQEKNLLTLPKMMLLLSFYFYFIKNAYLGSHKLLLSITSIPSSLMGKTSFQQLLIAWKEKFAGNMCSSLPWYMHPERLRIMITGLILSGIKSTLSVNNWAVHWMSGAGGSIEESLDSERGASST